MQLREASCLLAVVLSLAAANGPHRPKRQAQVAEAQQQPERMASGAQGAHAEAYSRHVHRSVGFYIDPQELNIFDSWLSAVSTARLEPPGPECSAVAERDSAWGTGDTSAVWGHRCQTVQREHPATVYREAASSDGEQPRACTVGRSALTAAGDQQRLPTLTCGSAFKFALPGWRDIPRHTLSIHAQVRMRNAQMPCVHQAAGHSAIHLKAPASVEAVSCSKSG